MNNHDISWRKEIVKLGYSGIPWFHKVSRLKLVAVFRKLIFCPLSFSTKLIFLDKIPLKGKNPMRWDV